MVALRLLCILLLCGTSYAGEQVQIDPAHHTYNESGFDCAWCSVETLGKHNGLKIGNISKEYAGPSSLKDVTDALNHKKIKYRAVCHKGDYAKCDYIKKEFLEKPCREGLGTVVMLDDTAPGSHMLVVVHYDPIKKDVRVADNTHKKLCIERLDWGYFHSAWTGCAIYLTKN